MTWDEERAGRALRSELLRIETPASRVAMERVVLDGRRAERRARIVTALGGAALAVVVGAPLALLAARGTEITDRPAWRGVPPAACTTAALDASGLLGSVEAVDPTGTLLFGVNGGHLVRWRDGASEIVATSTTGGLLMPTDVNSAGVAVGFYAADPPGTSAPQAGWVFRDGVVTPLALPAGARTATPHAVNEAGDIAGAAMPATGPTPSVPVVWPAGSPGSPRMSGPDAAGAAIAITADGTMVGSVTGAHDIPVVWDPDGGRRSLSVPAGWTGASALVVRGDVVYGTVRRETAAGPRALEGQAASAAGPDDLPTGGGPPVVTASPVRWNLRDGTSHVYPVDGGLAAVSDSGWLLVTVSTDGRIPDQLVIVRPDGRARALPMPAVERPSAARGVYISEDGRTVVGQTFLGGIHRPVRWTCA
jgi:uncharacterized membrane protein